MELFKSAVPVNMNMCGSRINRCQSNPAVLEQPLQGAVRLDHFRQPLRSGLDHEENPDWLVNFNHLPGQSRAQVASMTVHDPHQASNVVRQFRPTSISVVVDKRKVVFKADACADGHSGGEQCRQGIIAGIYTGVIGNQKCPPIEEEAPRQAATPDDANRICAVAVFGAWLREMFASFFHVTKRALRIRILQQRFESPGALESVLGSRPIPRPTNGLLFREMG